MKYLSKIAFAVMTFSFLASAKAGEAATPKVYKAYEMNGFKLSDFPDFEKKWKLVTVRYRKDTGEMRLTYANELAAENLLKGVTDYPEGSVFAKIGIKTVEDSAFPSSAVPAGARRYQFMVRDKKKFASTDGWGYALFDKSGQIYPEDQALQSAACAACHHIVPERGYVFSQLMELSVFQNASAAAPKKETHYSERIKFKEVPAEKIPEIVKKELPKDVKTAKQVVHEISKFLFQGTLDEVKPLLAEESVKSKMPVYIVSPDEKAFAVVYVENNEIMCDQEGKKGYFMKAISSSLSTNVPNYENRFCWTSQ
jgi:hypothetical protein